MAASLFYLRKLRETKYQDLHEENSFHWDKLRLGKLTLPKTLTFCVMQSVWPTNIKESQRKPVCIDSYTAG